MGRRCAERGGTAEGPRRQLGGAGAQGRREGPRGRGGDLGNLPNKHGLGTEPRAEPPPQGGGGGTGARGAARPGTGRPTVKQSQQSAIEGNRTGAKYASARFYNFVQLAHQLRSRAPGCPACSELSELSQWHTHPKRLAQALQRPPLSPSRCPAAPPRRGVPGAPTCALSPRAQS